MALLRNDVLFSLILTHKKGLGNAKVVGSLGCSDQSDYGVQHGMKRYQDREQDYDSGLLESNYGLFRDLLQEIPWDRVLAKKGLQEGWPTYTTSSS